MLPARTAIGLLAGLLALPASSLAGEIALENRDGVPFPDRLSFNQIGSNPLGLTTHDEATVRVLNEGSTDLTVTGLPVSGAFALAQPVTLPAVIPPGDGLDVAVRYTATGAGTPDPARHDGTLTIQSDDADEPSVAVQLAGLWMNAPGGSNERSLATTVGVFGYATTIIDSGQSLNRASRVEAVGEEAIAPYFTVLDPSRPVTVRHIASFHDEAPGTIGWFSQSATTSQTLAVQATPDRQTLFPSVAGGAPAGGSFTPAPGEVFGFRLNDVWSDPSRNLQPSNCTGACGHFMRFWPVEDRAGARMPGQYVMASDVPGGNYDYNDYIYLMTNVVPAGTPPDTTAPTVSARTPAPGATGVAAGANVTITFSEPVDPATVTATSATLTRGGTPVTASRTLSAGNTVLTLDPAADLAPTSAYDVGLTGDITDAAGNPLAPVAWSFTTGAAPPPPPAGAYQFVGTTVAMEAENADEVISRSGDTWTPGTTPAGAVGSRMTVLPDNGGQWATVSTVPATAPELRFRVQFPAAGTYRVSLRSNMPNTNGNSAHVGLNGVVTANSDFFGSSTYGSWLWLTTSAGGPNPARITVPSAGVHTVSVFPREDGYALDRVVISNLSAAAPTGTGPAESPRAGDPPPPPPPPPGDGPYQASGGAVTMEAENADQVVDRSSTGWDPGLAPAGSVGSALTIPNAGGVWSNLSTVPTVAPEIRFSVAFDQAGTYRVWVRSNPLDGSGDSLHAGLNGVVTATSDAINTTSYGNWVWAGYSAGGPNPATITVPSAGVHTVSIFGREDGMSVDRIHMSVAGAAPTGNGPAESPRG